MKPVLLFGDQTLRSIALGYSIRLFERKNDLEDLLPIINAVLGAVRSPYILTGFPGIEIRALALPLRKMVFWTFLYLARAMLRKKGF